MANTIYYVCKGNAGAAAPYDTWAKAADEIQTAVAAAVAVAGSHTINVKPGTGAYSTLIQFTDSQASALAIVGHKSASTVDVPVLVTNPFSDPDCPTHAGTATTRAVFGNSAGETLLSVSITGILFAPTNLDGGSGALFDWAGDGSNGNLSVIIDKCFVNMPASTSAVVFKSAKTTAGAATRTFSMTSSVVISPARATLTLAGWSTITITGNTITGQPATAGTMLSASGDTFSAITVTNNVYTGLQGVVINATTTTPTVTVTGNTFNTALDAISVTGNCSTATVTDNTVNLTGVAFAGYAIQVGATGESPAVYTRHVELHRNKVTMTDSNPNASSHLAFVGFSTGGHVTYNRLLDTNAAPNGFGLVAKGTGLHIAHNEIVAGTALYMVGAISCVVRSNTARGYAVCLGVAVTASGTQRPSRLVLVGNLLSAMRIQAAVLSVRQGASAANSTFGEIAAKVDAAIWCDGNLYCTAGNTTNPFALHSFDDTTNSASLDALQARWATVGQTTLAYNDLTSVLTTATPQFVSAATCDLRLMPGSVGLENHATLSPNYGAWGSLPTRRR